MTGFLLVFLGAGFGGALRYAVNLTCVRFCGPAFPWGTLTVNVAGCFVMGLIAAFIATRTDVGAWQNLRLFLLTGILGGFTTFSAFSLDLVLLWENGPPGPAIAYLFASVILSVAALIVGVSIARALA